jgi:uncharacterized protein (TIGR00369 family)
VTTEGEVDAPPAVPPSSPSVDARARARAEHDRVLAAGDHLIQQMAFRDVSDTGGDLTIELDLDARLTNPRGGLQGGLMATMADVVAGRAVFNGSPAGSACVTSDLTIHYLAALTVGPARARATVVQRGRSRAVANVDIIDVGTGRVSAVCTVAFSVFPGDAQAGGILET